MKTMTVRRSTPTLYTECEKFTRAPKQTSPHPIPHKRVVFDGQGVVTSVELSLLEYRRFASSQLDSAASLKEEGNALLSAGDPEAASHRYLEVLSVLDELERGSDAMARGGAFRDLARRCASLRQAADSNLAAAYLRERRFDEAARVAELAVSRARTEEGGDSQRLPPAKLLFRMAQARRGQGRLDEARKCVQEALKAEPDSADLKRLLRAVEVDAREAKARERGRFGGLFSNAGCDHTRSVSLHFRSITVCLTPCICSQAKRAACLPWHGLNTMKLERGDGKHSRSNCHARTRMHEMIVPTHN